MTARCKDVPLWQVTEKLRKMGDQLEEELPEEPEDLDKLTDHLAIATQVQAIRREHAGQRQTMAEDRAELRMWREQVQRAHGRKVTDPEEEYRKRVEREKKVAGEKS